MFMKFCTSCDHWFAYGLVKGFICQTEQFDTERVLVYAQAVFHFFDTFVHVCLPPLFFVIVLRINVYYFLSLAYHSKELEREKKFKETKACAFVTFDNSIHVKKAQAG